MSCSRPTIVAKAIIIALGLSAAACSQGPTNASNKAEGNDSAVTNNSSAAAPAAPAAPAPGAVALSPATGPLAIPSDANLPEQCRNYIQAAQACMDSIPGPADGMNPHMLRSTVNNDRTTWSREQTPELLARACTRHHDSLKEYARTRYQCRLG
jgi:hypothetical protein